MNGGRTIAAAITVERSLINSGARQR